MIEGLQNNIISDIAVVGMAGRFPGANNIEEYWDNLKNGVESISHFSNEELENEGIDKSKYGADNYIKAEGCLEGIEFFDAEFFGYTPREAEIMDPQHRIFLESAWEALESAGYNPDTYKGLIGVYAGASMNTYLIYNLLGSEKEVETAGEFETLIGSDKDFLATKVAYKLNLKGPAFTLGSACSTSLVASHIACQGLQNYECDMALAGGIAISGFKKSGYEYREGSILSPDGHCRAFDEAAGGTVPGKGVGIVVLKRLEDAIRDRDIIYSVIKGSAVNNDGALKVGYTAPSVDGQADVIATAQEIACVNPETITYIEAHGTGTPMGDPIEIAALNKVFKSKTDKKNFCAIGSVKSNIGHLDTAAGVAGLIKTSLSIRNRVIVPSLNYTKVNPQIDFENNPFYINTQLREWECAGSPLRAGVSSFGIGGTNVHMILEEAPDIGESNPSNKWNIIMLSAKTISALDESKANVINFLKNNENVNLSDMAYTLQVGRKKFPYSIAISCSNVKDASFKLESITTYVNQEKEDRHVAFMFPGQGSQYVNMGKELYEEEPVFKKNMDHCAELLMPIMGLDIRDLIYPKGLEEEVTYTKLKQTEITQPVIFSLEYSLTQMWQSKGIKAEAMIGHSLGEFVAACMADVMSLSDALRLIAIRGKLIQTLPAGSMLSVLLPEDEMVKCIKGTNISIAAINGNELGVISGESRSIAEIEKEMIGKGISTSHLHTSHAFHSSMMTPILEDFRREVEKINLQPPSKRYISNVSGDWIQAEEAISPEYWVNQLISTVRFSEGIEKIIAENMILLEVGPGNTLSTFAKQKVSTKIVSDVICSLPHIKETKNSMEYMMESFGKLWSAGAHINWEAYYKDQLRNRLLLPTYPFEKKEFWINSSDRRGMRYSNFSDDNLEKNSNMLEWFYSPVWKQSTGKKSYAKVLNEKRDIWLVFTDELNLGLNIIEKLKSIGKQVIMVSIGKSYIKHSPNEYSIDCKNLEDYVHLIEEILNYDMIPDHVVHMFSLTEYETGTGVDYFKHCQEKGFYSVLFLTKALARNNLINNIQIDIISNNVFDVVGNEQICPEKVTIFGPCIVIPQEYLNMSCRGIDIDITNNQNIEELTTQITSELVANPTDVFIAFRSGKRWIKDYELIRQEETIMPVNPLRANGTYMILDGLEGLGYAFTDYFTKIGNVKLLLVEFKPFPDESDWDEWLRTHKKDDEISLKIQRIKTLKSKCEIVVFCINLLQTSESILKINSFIKVENRLNGVIHAPATIGPRWINPIQDIDQKLCEQNFSMKIYGMYVLQEVLKEEELDFCIIQASLGSILGGLGFSAYSAGNLFLESFVGNYNKLHTKKFKILNWDFWEEEWENIASFVGEGTDLANSLSKLNVIRFSISPSEGEDALKRVFYMDETQHIIISTADLKQRVDRWINLTPMKRNEVEEKETNLYPRPILSNEYISPTNKAENEIGDTWERLLGISPIGIDDDFYDLGGHSLLASKIISELREKFKVDIPIRLMFEAPTIRKTAIFIDELVKNKNL